jgi:hypothetical protein
MILITDKKKEIDISKINYLHNKLNDFYINEIFAYQNDSIEYQNILTRFSNLVDTLYKIIKDMEYYNNNNNNNGEYYTEATIYNTHLVGANDDTRDL